MKELKYLVTGTGRCGTVFLARVLSRSGVECGHESIFTPSGLEEAMFRLCKVDVNFTNSYAMTEGHQSWVLNKENLTAESSYMAAPYLWCDHLFQSTKIVHLVRNPMLVISSFLRGIGYFKSHLPVWFDKNNDAVYECEFHKFIYRYLPELAQNISPIERAILYYVKWNEMIESYYDLHDGKMETFHLEDGIESIFDFLGVSVPNEWQDLVGSNKMAGYLPLTIEDVPEGDVKNHLTYISERYGYKISNRKMFLI